MIVTKIVPLIVFLCLGVLCRFRGYVRAEVIEGLKWIIVNILLPGVLFSSFLFAQINMGLLLVALSVCAANFIMFGLGKFISPALTVGRRYVQFLSGGMEYGMLGLALFSSLYGVEAVQYISIIDLGHELFFWFFLAPLFQAREGGRGGFSLKSFIRSPINIAIFAGIVINLSGGSGFFSRTSIGEGVASLCEMMGQAIGPLILIVIGYGLKIIPSVLHDVVVTCILRFAAAFGTAYCVGNLLVGRLLGWPSRYVAATWILFMTAPSFSIPVFSQTKRQEEDAYITSTIAFYTLISIVAAFIVFSLYP